MKKGGIILLIALSVFLIYSYGQSENQTAFSKEALESKMHTLEGNQKAFSDILKQYKGKTVVIDVWASWCSDCIKGMPKVVELQNNFPEITYLFISMDKNPEAWKKGIEKHQVKGEHYLVTDGMKGVFGKSVSLNWIPRYLVVDKKGKIALFKAIEADDRQLLETLKKLQ